MKKIVENGETLTVDNKLGWVLRTMYHDTHLEDMAPIFTLIIESLIQHLHYFNKVISANMVSADEGS